MSRPLNRRDFLRMLTVGLGLSAVSIPILGHPTRAMAAVELDGTGDEVDFGNLAAFNSPSVLSYCFWIFHFETLGSGVNNALIGKAGQFYSYVSTVTANNLAAGVSGASERLTATNVIPNNSWTQCAYIYDSVALQILTGDRGALVNQPLTGTEPSFGTNASALTLGFGSGLTRPAAHFAIFKAWSAKLTVPEMQIEVLSHRPQRLTDLVLWAPGEDVGSMRDYSGNDRHGAFVADARLSAFSPSVEIGD